EPLKVVRCPNGAPAAHIGQEAPVAWPMCAPDANPRFAIRHDDPNARPNATMRSVPSLIECVPNFSEGRRPEIVAEIVRAVRQIDGVTLLDHSLDATHNRSVVTFAGAAEPLVRAATAAVGRALELIDMTQHTGAHPR